MPGQVLLKTPTSPAPAWFDQAAAHRIAEAGGALEPPVSGTVYGAVLNVRSQVEQMAEAMTRPPYQAPARAPVLYIKPPNTYLESGGMVALPQGVEALEIQPTLGLVIGGTATRVAEARAWSHVAGMVLAAEVCLPHTSLYRPAVRQRCRDGFLPLGSPQAPIQASIEVRLKVDGILRASLSTADLVRPIPRLLAEVTDFMTLYPGDVLLVGLPLGQDLVGAGAAVSVEADGFPTLGFGLAAEFDLDEGEAA
jgi:5-oxopent-3-ene-1,2,5-tricarboxylate decarboxylase/2-hydroxyhepta-2,4-diene-1,7-dioate isomerase